MTSRRTSKLRETPQGGPGPEPSHRRHGVNTPVDRHHPSLFVKRPAAADRRRKTPTRAKGGRVGGVGHFAPPAGHAADVVSGRNRAARSRGDDSSGSEAGRGAHRRGSWCQLKVWAADPLTRRGWVPSAGLVDSADPGADTSRARNPRGENPAHGGMLANPRARFRPRALRIVAET